MKNTILFRFLPYHGMAFYPFILLRNKKLKGDEVLINHEKIHLAQQKELLIVFFYIFYFLNYVINLLRFFNHNKAYRNIIFEKEAYTYEKDLLYLQKRKPMAFLKFNF